MVYVSRACSCFSLQFIQIDKHTCFFDPLTCPIVLVSILGRWPSSSPALNHLPGYLGEHGWRSKAFSRSSHGSAPWKTVFPYKPVVIRVHMGPCWSSAGQSQGPQANMGFVKESLLRGQPIVGPWCLASWHGCFPCFFWLLETGSSWWLDWYADQFVHEHVWKHHPNQLKHEDPQVIIDLFLYPGQPGHLHLLMIDWPYNVFFPSNPETFKPSISRS